MSNNNVALKQMPTETTNQQTEEPVVVYQTSGTGRYVYSVFHLIMSFVAIYLSFKCNNGFNFGSFLVAFCCPYIYIIFILATKGTCGVLEGENQQIKL
jgi:hypothetical protein